MLLTARAIVLKYPALTALAAGILSATGFAPLGLWPLTLAMLALLIALLGHAHGHRHAFKLGWLFGLGHFTLGLNWIATAFTFQAAMPAWLGWLAVPLLSIYLALFPGLATWAAWAGARLIASRHGEGRHVPQTLEQTEAAPPPASLVPLPVPGRNRDVISRTLLFAATWIVTEWLRSWVFTGFAWNPLAAIMLADGWAWSLLPSAILAQIGTYGVSGTLVVVSGLLLHLATLPPKPDFPENYWKASLSPDEYVRKIVREAEEAKNSTPFSYFLIYFIFIFLLPRSSPMYVPLYNDNIYSDLTIIQPNIEQGDKWDVAQRTANFAKLAALSRRDPSDDAPRLLLWPEAAVPDYLEPGYPADWYLEDPAAVRARLAALLGPDDLLLTGAVKLIPDARGQDVVAARNSIFTLDAGGALGPSYDKAHLVPYGEYLPMRGLLEPLGLSRLAPGSVDFLPGPGPRTLDLGRFGKVGIQICYEIIFSGRVVDRANRPAFLFNPSNDAWFGSWGPPQHLAQARLRAIEEGLPVVRATPTGISAVIAADGTIMRHIPAHTAGRIDIDVPPAARPTFFAQHGNRVPLVLAVLLTVLATLPWRRRVATRS